MKIEVMNKETGEITLVEANATLGQIVGVSNMTEEEVADAIAADIKGLSPAKVSEVLKMLIDKSKPFFGAIDAIRNGESAKRYRLVIEEVEPTNGGNSLKHNEENVEVEAEVEAEVEVEVEDAETVEDETEEVDDDQEYLKIYEQAKVLFAANDLVNAAELKKKFSIDKETADRMWSDLENDDDFADQRDEEQAKAEDGNSSEEASTEAEKPKAPEGEPSPYADDPTDPAKARGQKAFLRGDGPDDNPFDGGTPENVEWSKNYDHAKASMKKLFDEGEEQAKAGVMLADCPYEVGSVKFNGWKAGYDSVEQVEAPKTTDSHGDGYQAAIDGGSAEDNPHAAGMTKHRIWNEGFEAGKAELAKG